MAPLTALRGLSGLTHLELGGGCAPDGWEHGYAHPGYGAGMSADDLQHRRDAHEDGASSGSSSASCCSGLGCLACSDNTTSLSSSRSNGSRSESSKRRDLAPSGFEALGHEFRIPMKGVTGRLGSLACHRHLVREISSLSLFFCYSTGGLATLENEYMLEQELNSVFQKKCSLLDTTLIDKQNLPRADAHFYCCCCCCCCQRWC